MGERGKGKQDFRTPPWLFKLLEQLIGQRFKLDAAASKANALCKKYYTKQTNGLVQPWLDPTFVNPGFRELKYWLHRACEYQQRDKLTSVVIGTPGCSQSWFHNYAKRGTCLAPTQRIAFFDDNGNPTRGADRDTMVYMFGPKWRNCGPNFRVLTLNVDGLVVKLTSS